MDDVEETKKFSLIESWWIIKEDAKVKAITIEVNLSDRFYNLILGNAKPTMDKGF